MTDEPVGHTLEEFLAVLDHCAGHDEAMSCAAFMRLFEELGNVTMTPSEAGKLAQFAGIQAGEWQGALLFLPDRAAAVEHEE